MAAALAIPVLFRLRMVRFVIIDKPGIGAMAALRESRKMMKGNCLKLFKLDVRLWLYYAGSLAASILSHRPLMDFSLRYGARANLLEVAWAVSFALVIGLLLSRHSIFFNPLLRRRMTCGSSPLADKSLVRTLLRID